MCFLKCDRNKDITSPPRAWEALRQSSDALLSLDYSLNFSPCYFLLQWFTGCQSIPLHHRFSMELPDCLSGPSSPVLCIPFGCRKAVKCSPCTQKDVEHSHGCHQSRVVQWAVGQLILKHSKISLM